MGSTSPALVLRGPRAEQTFATTLGNHRRSAALTIAPQEHADLTTFLGRLIELFVLAIVMIAFLVAHVLAWHWVREPFLGLLLEPTLVFSPTQGIRWVLAVLWCAAVPFVAATAMHLAMIFPQEPCFVLRIPVLRLFPYLPATFLAFRSAFSVYDISQPWEYINHWRNSYLFAAVGIFFLLGMLVYWLVRAPSPLVRQRSRVILLGTVLVFLPVVLWLLLDVLGQPVPFPAPVYALLLPLFPLSIAYVTLRYRLLDIDRLLSQGLAYEVLTCLIVVAYFALVNGMSHLFAIEAGNPVLLSLFVLMLILVFDPLRHWVQRLVDRAFFREAVDYQSASQDFSHRLTQTLDLDAVLAKVGEQIEKALHPVHQWVCLYDEDRACYVGQPMGRGHPASSPVILVPDGALARWLRDHQECLYLPTGQDPPAELADEWAQMGALGAVVYVPLCTQEQLSGWLALGPQRSGQPYCPDGLAFLNTLSEQSASAIENARRFAGVRRNLAATTEMKHLMDDVFNSIASGVITTDVQSRVMFFNHAAEAILGIRADDVIGHPCQQVLCSLGDDLQHLVELVKRSGTPMGAYEVQPELPTRGPVWLRMNLSPLKDSRGVVIGVTIVVDDLTERQQLKARMRRIRATFERYIAPTVVEQLLSNPETVRLGGMHREVTSLYADIREFTAFSEKTAPEFQIEVLNSYLTLAAGAILAQDGTLDKFVGDGAMAIFNAPVSQEDHTLRAVRAALAMRQAVREHHVQVDERERLHFGIGITVGEAVVGNIGSPVVQSFTAIGDCVNFSCRLSDLAGPGQILISAEVYERVKGHVEARFIGYVQVKGHSQPDPVYEVLGLISESEEESHISPSSHPLLLNPSA